MYKEHRGGNVLEIEQQYCEAAKEVYALASIKKDIILVNLINTNMKLSKVVEVDFGTEVDFVDAEILASDTPNAYNSFEEPDRIHKNKGKAPEQNGSVHRILIPAASVSVYRFRKKLPDRLI
jgi:alpha-N-arabinofuranosidase